MNNIVIYLSGQYSGNIDANIAKAKELAEKVWEAGFVCLCPHCNTAHFKGDYQRFLDGDLILIQRCDAMLMIEGWEQSNGANIEHDFAKLNGIPVFYSLEELTSFYQAKVYSEL